MCSEGEIFFRYRSLIIRSMVDGLNSMVPGLPSDSHGLAEFLKPFGSPSSKIYIPINMRQSCNILEDKKGKFAEEK